MIETILDFGTMMAGLVALKAILIGSDFNFIALIEYRNQYWNWYNNRETFDDYLKRKEKNV
jgi:hypothetical protein